jgi:UDP-N-acetylmuramoyl-tripeptide--D-alanyl-D-alanine ligase
MEAWYQLFKDHPLVCTDTRKIKPGCIFFALKGDRFDGNAFANEALEKGAAYAVVDNPCVIPHTTEETIKYVLVPDVLKTLQQLSAYHRLRYNVPIIALTGSNGKTTTKELIRTVLSARYTVTATEGNLNNHIGLPLTLLNINSRTDIVVVEMGTSHAGEIALLTSLCRPTAGLITNVGGAHLEGLGDVEGIKKEKGALYDYLKNHEGTAFCHVNDSILTGMLTERGITDNVVFYGTGLYAENEQSGESVQVMQQDGRLVLQVPGYPKIQTQLTGLYNVPNVLAALAVGTHFGIAPEQAAAAIAAYVSANNRSQWVQTTHNICIADGYNANPVSMRLALENWHSLPGEGKCAVLGDMLELGAAAHQAHVDMVRLVVAMKPDQVFWVGTHFSRAVKEEKAVGMCFATTEELMVYLKEHPLKDKIILIKGSNGIGLHRLIPSGAC